MARHKRRRRMSQPAKEKKDKPGEIFDSSRYDAMSDMTKGASVNRLADEQAVMDLQKKERMDPKEIGNKSMAAQGTESTAKINPMVAEERARTIREINEEKLIEMQPQAERETFPDWTEVMARQYAEMSAAGIELYSQFLKSAADATMMWFRIWLPDTRDKSD
jgi:hypothetical protein